MEEKIDEPSLLSDHETSEKKDSKKKITIVVDEDDPCLKKKDKVQDKIQEEDRGRQKFQRSPGNDPRFQQQNQTQRCFVMYTDFYRCEHILGKGSEACTWFKDVFTSICPNAWVQHWDELRLTGRLTWHKYKTQGAFPGHKYGLCTRACHEDNLPIFRCCLCTYNNGIPSITSITIYLLPG